MNMFEISYYYRLRQAFVRVIPSLPAAGKRSQVRLSIEQFLVDESLGSGRSGEPRIV
jgi:hypothetical protein